MSSGCRLFFRHIDGQKRCVIEYLGANRIYKGHTCDQVIIEYEQKKHQIWEEKSRTKYNNGMFFFDDGLSEGPKCQE
jgi:hypothetical protein